MLSLLSTLSCNRFSTLLMATQHNHVNATLNYCAMCPSKGEFRCSRCQSSSYCSRKCETVDSRCHQLLCTKFIQQGARPSPRHRRGLEFPDSGAGPRFVWVHCEAQYDEDEGAYQAPDVKPYFEHATGNSFPRLHLIRRNLKLDRTLRDVLELRSRDGFLIDESIHNLAEYTDTSCKGIVNALRN